MEETLKRLVFILDNNGAYQYLSLLLDCDSWWDDGMSINSLLL